MMFLGIIVRFAHFAFSHDFDPGEFAELKLGAGDKVRLARRCLFAGALVTSRSDIAAFYRASGGYVGESIGQ